MTHGDCHDSEPLLAAVALQCARPDQLRAIELHAADCSTCSKELEESRQIASEPLDHLSVSQGAKGIATTPSRRVRIAVFARVRADLGPTAVDPRRVAIAVAAGAAASLVGLAVANWRSPLAGGLPLLLCAVTWTAMLSLGFYLTGSATRERARVALGGLVAAGALLGITAICPAPSLALAGRVANWAPSMLGSGAMSEWFTGIGFGVLPVLIAFIVSIGGRPKLGTTAMLTLGLVGIELTLLFAQCCNLPLVSAVPLLLGATAGAGIGFVAARFASRLLVRRNSASHGAHHA